ncbi:MAG TPA: helix-turn-helix domain-containing protein [Thermoanaerobaculia bacterium]|jgi:AcrR family transcriptional regulator|nr:helix-turn-helix domain-containing protein [Thermoanaerobaculia bacterium]
MSPRGRPRREGADESILAGARALLAETGYAALTVDAVAERVGVAKTTVYRRWPTKRELIAAALTATSSAPSSLAALYAEVLSSVRDTEAEVVLAVVEARREQFRAYLSDVAIDMLIGPLLKGHAFEAVRASLRTT